MIEYSCRECDYTELDIEIRPNACCPVCGQPMSAKRNFAAIKKQPRAGKGNQYEKIHCNYRRFTTCRSYSWL